MSATKNRKKTRKQIEKKEKKTRTGPRPIVADGWVGAEMRVFTLSNLIIMDGPTDGQTERQTDI